jgi:hypothetical protein
MRFLSRLSELDLIRIHFHAYRTLNKYNTAKAFTRLYLVVAEIDRREYASGVAIKHF